MCVIIVVCAAWRQTVMWWFLWRSDIGILGEVTARGCAALGFDWNSPDPWPMSAMITWCNNTHSKDTPRGCLNSRSFTVPEKAPTRAFSLLNASSINRWPGQQRSLIAVHRLHYLWLCVQADHWSQFLELDHTLAGFLRSHRDLSSPHQPSVFLWSNTFLFMIKNIFIKANWVGLCCVAARGGVKVKPVQGDTPVNIIRQYCWDCYWVLWGLKMKEFHWCDVAMARAVISQERGHESDDNDLSWTEPRRRSCLSEDWRCQHDKISRTQYSEKAPPWVLTHKTLINKGSNTVDAP